MTHDTHSNHSLKRMAFLPLLGIGLIFMAVTLAALWWDTRLGFHSIFADQYYYWTWMLLWAHPHLYALDKVLHDPTMVTTSIWVFPAYYGLLKLLASRFDLFTTFSLLQVILSMSYLAGMFLFLYKLCGRPWISAFVALLSANVISVFPSEEWGVLHIRQALPSTFFYAFYPLLFWAWLQYRGDLKKQCLIYFVLGVLGLCFHPLSWAIVLAAMLFARLVDQRFSKAVWKEVLLCGIVSTLPLIPFIMIFCGFLQESYHASPQETDYLIGAIHHAFPPTDPAILSQWWQSALADLGWTIVTIWAWCSVRSKIPRSLYYFAGCCLLMFVGYYTLDGFVLPSLHRLPVMVMDGFRTLKPIVLPMLMIVTWWLASFEGKALWWRAIAVLLLVTVLNRATFFPEKPGAVPSVAHAAMVAQWFGKNTSPDTTMAYLGYRDDTLIDMIRAIGERSVAISQGDGPTLYYRNKPLFLKWFSITSQLELTRATNGECSTLEVQYARQLGATHFVCPSALSAYTIHLPVVYRDAYLSVYSLK